MGMAKTVKWSQPTEGWYTMSVARPLSHRKQSCWCGWGDGEQMFHFLLLQVKGRSCDLGRGKVRCMRTYHSRSSSPHSTCSHARTRQPSFCIHRRLHRSIATAASASDQRRRTVTCRPHGRALPSSTLETYKNVSLQKLGRHRNVHGMKNRKLTPFNHREENTNNLAYFLLV